jgi:hypothetical protein
MGFLIKISDFSVDLFFGPVNVFFALAGGEISLAAIGGIIAF